MEIRNLNLKKLSLPTDNVLLVILFGSHAKGSARNNSDIDIAILAKQPLTLSWRSNITERLAKELEVSEDRIDLVDVHNASPLLQYQIAKTGKLLAGTSSDFVRFRVLAWKRYVDTARFRRLRRAALDTWFLGNTTKI